MTANNHASSATPVIGHHAVVIGGSMAGLLAARVLADFYAHVTVVDRDEFPTAPDHRKGVPQSHHAHALLERGQQIINGLFSGIIDDLRADGAAAQRNVVPVVFVTAAGKLPPLQQPGEFVAFSRYRLEWHVRQRLAARPNVALLATTNVLELTAAADGTHVTGVRLRSRDGNDDTMLHADLVVDASGRQSRAPQWLASLGYDAPPEETINSGLGYASRFYRKPANFPAEWQGLIVNGRPPHNPRAGLILPVEHDMWHVSLGGFAGVYPPTNEAGFLAWARLLADPSLFEAIRVAEPLTPIKGYRTPTNRWRHFERLARWPQGFVVTGDAVCAFNPIYGQGMTVSATDAEVLQRSLLEQQRRPRANWEYQFQRALATNVAGVWSIASGEDLRWPGVKLSGAQPSRTLALRHQFMDLVLAQAAHDPLVTAAYLNVISMTAPPTALMQPAVLGRVLGGALQRLLRRGTPAPVPALALSPDAITDLQTRPTAG